MRMAAREGRDEESMADDARENIRADTDQRRQRSGRGAAGYEGDKRNDEQIIAGEKKRT